MNRRTFISSGSLLLAGSPLRSVPLAGVGSLAAAGQATKQAPTRAPSAPPSPSPADYTLNIQPCSIEISPGLIIKTVGYNGSVPGPLLRLHEGASVTIDVNNKLGHAELVHWHGLAVSPANDGAMEEGSPMIAAGGHARYTFTPNQPGTRWYHTHNTAGVDLSIGTYSGQFGFLIVDGKKPPARYDQEFLLAVHHWEPSFVSMAETMQLQSANHPMTSGSDVGYKYATINQHRLGAGEPLRVKQGQKVLMRLLNASATENVVLALPGHTFRIVAMDGNPVPNPKDVDMVSLAAAERVDAIVEMNTPGVWVLGSTLEKSRQMGLGVVVEYEGKSGAPVWKDPSPVPWDYTQFASGEATPEPDETFKLAFMDIGPQKDSRFDTWTINGKSWPDIEPLMVKHGKRYRLIFQNITGDQHPMHLHRHTFEVTSVGDRKVSGLKKDVINVMPLETVAVDFLADNPGDTLLHCHMQLHMDFGFMQLIRYAT